MSMTSGEASMLARVARIMDEGTTSNGWDVGIMEAIWELVTAAGWSRTCPNCHFEYSIMSNNGECPFDFCEIYEEEEEDDEGTD